MGGVFPKSTTIVYNPHIFLRAKMRALNAIIFPCRLLCFRLVVIMVLVFTYLLWTYLWWNNNLQLHDFLQVVRTVGEKTHPHHPVPTHWFGKYQVCLSIVRISHITFNPSSTPPTFDQIKSRSLDRPPSYVSKIKTRSPPSLTIFGWKKFLCSPPYF